MILQTGEESVMHKTLPIVEAVMGADDNSLFLDGQSPSKYIVVEAPEAKPTCKDKLPNTKNNRTRKSRTTATNFVHFIMSHFFSYQQYKNSALFSKSSK